MKEIDLNTEELEEIRSLLSKESYTNIKNEIMLPLKSFQDLHQH